MNGIWIMAGITFREAARRKILWTAMIAGALLLAIFAVALHLQVDEFNSRAMSPFLRYQIESGMLMVGLYTVDLLAVVMTILTSIDTLAGEISSGTIHAIATKPVSRWQILIGKIFRIHRNDFGIRRGAVRRNCNRKLLGGGSCAATCRPRSAPDYFGMRGGAERYIFIGHMVFHFDEWRSGVGASRTCVHGRMAGTGEWIFAERAHCDVRSCDEFNYAGRIVVAARGF